MNKAVKWLEDRFNQIWETNGETYEQVPEGIGPPVKFFHVHYNGPGPINNALMIKFKHEPESVWSTPFQWSPRGICGGYQSENEQLITDHHVHFEFRHSDIQYTIDDLDDKQ